MSLSFNAMKVALSVALEANQVPNIVGLQGIGKSDLVREYCKENNYFFTEITCSLIQEGDLAMPYLKEGGKSVGYSINSIIKSLEEMSPKYKYVVLFLDEFNRATEQAQSELMNLVLQRRVVNYNLPENARLILAMNPNSDMEGYEDTRYSVSLSDSAIMGRIVNLNLEPSLDDWLSYAGRKDEYGKTIIHKSVSSFLCNYKSLFITEEKQGAVNNTPRGWSRASDLIYSFEKLNISNDSILRNLLSGTLDSNVVSIFFEYYKDNREGLNYHEIALSLLKGEPYNIEELGTSALSDVFDFMCDIIVSNNVKIDKELAKTVLRGYLKFVPRELCHALISRLERSYKDLFFDVVEDSSFAEYVVTSTLSKNSSKKKGSAFHGKL